MDSVAPVDVVIPVFNAPEATRRCIDSLYKHAAPHLGRVLVQDDASAGETARLLDALDHPRLEVAHAAANAGFGAAVNRGMARARSPLVLVLNSDVEARDDFVAPLAAAMAREPGLACVAPTGEPTDPYDLARYRRRGGCIPTYSLWGYAFLVRRGVFDAVGGFAAVFGRGYREDVDLGRRLLARGHWLAVHPDARVHHEGGASFRDVEGVPELVAANRLHYLRRHPASARRVLLLTREAAFARLPAGLQAEVEAVLAAGGRVEWMCAGGGHGLPGLPMRTRPPDLRRTLRMLWRRQREHPWRRTTDLWLLRGAPAWPAAALARIARARGVAVRRWPVQAARA